MIQSLGNSSPAFKSRATSAPRGNEAAPPADGFSPSNQPAFEEGQLLVRLREGSSLTGETVAEKYGVSIAEDLTPGGLLRSQEPKLLLVELKPGQDTLEMKAALAADPRVAYAELNTNYYLDDQGQQPPGQQPPPQPPAQNIPNDLKSGLWGLHNTGQNNGKPDADIDAPEAWHLHTGSRNGPVIAVIDTGIDYNHPDLKANMWTNPGEIAGNGIDDDGNGVIDDVHGFNAFANNGNPMDGHSHGTHCAGTIAAVGNNDEGVVGVNHEAQLMAVKIFSDGGSTNAAAIIRGINYATRMGARITSNSWGGGAANQAIYDAFNTSPALHIMAAGNSSGNNDVNPHYPSNYDLPNNVAVAASDRNDNRASFSCYGATTVDIAAPGRDILSTVPGGGYASKSGTSMATPHVAGVAGLVASLYPEASNEEIQYRLYEGADKLSNWQGVVVDGRRLNAYGALTTAPPAPPAPPQPQPPAEQPPAGQQPPVGQG